MRRRRRPPRRLPLQPQLERPTHVHAAIRHRRRLGKPHLAVSRLRPRQHQVRRRGSHRRPRRGQPARRREAGRRLGHAPVDQEGRAAVLPPGRQRRDPRRLHELLRQGRAEVRRLRRCRLPRRRLPGRAACRRAQGLLHREERRADAVVREHRRLRRRSDDGRHVGHRRLVRPDREERPPVRRRRHRRRARTHPGEPDHHRGQLLHRRAFRGRRGRDRRRGFRDLDGRLPRPEHEDLQPRDRRDLLRPHPAGLGRRVGQPALRRRQVQPLLRRDREAGRRDDALEDQHQRTAARRLTRNAAPPARRHPASRGASPSGRRPS